MNRNILISLAVTAALGTALTTSAVAQQGNRIVVPLSHPSQPATLRVSTLEGSIVVRAYNGDQIIVNTNGGGHVRVHSDSGSVPPGMHRLGASAGLSASEDNNVVTVSTSIFGGSQNLEIQVPNHTSLRLSTVNGDRVEVDGVSGDISAEATNGNVRLNNVSGSIVASALNGNITARITHLDTNKPSSFSSMNGTINLTLPADIHADLRLKTARGNIYMDNGLQFQQTRGPNPTGERNGNGMYRVQVNRAIYGTLNGGGAQIRVQNFNGDIYIHAAH